MASRIQCVGIVGAQLEGALDIWKTLRGVASFEVRPSASVIVARLVRIDLDCSRVVCNSTVEFSHSDVSTSAPTISNIEPRVHRSRQGEICHGISQFALVAEGKTAVDIVACLFPKFDGGRKVRNGTIRLSLLLIHQASSIIALMISWVERDCLRQIRKGQFMLTLLSP